MRICEKLFFVVILFFYEKMGFGLVEGGPFL